MIHSIDSDHKKFKKINFSKGFNVVLAERTRESSQKDSRNGLGKSTMINIIHFCLGGDPKDALNDSKLEDSTFTIELDLDEKRYKVSRSPGNKGQIFIDGDYSSWSIKPKTDTETGKKYLNKNSWRNILGKLMFDLPIGLQSFNPSFGSMISYFIRKHEGFLDAFKQSSAQLTWDIQTNNAYLLDLGWIFATELQILRKKKNDLDAFKREINTGNFKGFMGNTGELEAERVRLQIHADKEKEKLNKFQVNDQYEQIEKEANDITDTIHNKTNQSVMDKLLLNRYNVSLEQEKVADIQQISEVYQEAGMYFSERITKTLEEVNEFHNKIIENRKEFLNSEITQLKSEIISRTQIIEQLDKKRLNLMQILNTQGALKEYTEVQKNHSNSQSELNDIKAEIR
ncbi:MAG: AAA family ATPase [Candidatus Nitrosoabyssus spongiisocia]|nr:MAG: AAA family ATPase [Nitrosopumilaceae archaeon AB1(1)]